MSATVRASGVSRATVVVVGVGGIGSPCAWALARAGVGRLRLVDFDRVEESNLPRQVLFSSADVGRPKAVVAAEALARHGIALEPVVARFDLAGGPVLVAGADVVVDATDGAATKTLVHAVSVRAGVPFVHAAALGAEGRVLDVPPGGKPCLACLFGTLAGEGDGDTCASVGVWPALAGAVGYLAAEAALARLVEPAAPSRGLRVLDLDAPRAITLAAAADPGCPVCGPRPVPLEDLVPAARPRAAVVARPPATALDLTRETCPMNLLRARRALDATPAEGTLEIWLGEEGAASVPEGLLALGHAIVSREERDGALRIFVRRGAARAAAR